MNLLDKLFGSHARARLLKLFYLNPEAVFSVKEAGKRAHTNPALTRREIRAFHEIGFVKEATGMTILKLPKGKKKKMPVKKRFKGFIVNPLFPLFSELRDLVLTVPPLSKRELTVRFKKLGRIKLAVLSGIFLKQSDSRVDMLIVADNVKKISFDRTIKLVEAEVGKELAYTVLETQDFKYRLGMNDKFIRDVFDYPHEIIIDKIGIVR